jgi:hypothetical protein
MNKNFLIMILHKVLDWEKDPNPEHWRTISGAKVHLDENGEIDGGAGGNFNGNYWDGKKGQQHIIGPHTMIKKQNQSGATMFNMAAMGAFGGNKVEPTKPEEPVKPARKPKAPKEPDFVFPQVKKKTQPNNLTDFKTEWVLNDIIRSAKYLPETHPRISLKLDELEKLTGVPKSELQAPDTPEKRVAQFGSAFSEANNTRSKPFTKSEIKKFQAMSEVFKNSDPLIAKIVLSGINVESLGKTPEEVYDIWKATAKTLERLNDEKKNGTYNDFAEWKKSIRGKTKADREKDFLREQALNETEETLKRQAKIYKPDNVAGVAKGPDMSFQDADGKNANPNYRSIWDKDYKEGYRINCQTCVIAYEMRRRGYNVEALPNNKNNPFQSKVASWGDLDYDGSAKAWIRPDGTHPIPKQMNTSVADEQYRWLSDNTEEGARYTFCFCWQGSGAHIIHAFKEGGVVKLYDPQNGQLYEGEEKVKTYVSGIAVNKGSRKPNPRLTRIDDCAPDMFYVNRVLTASK